MSFISTKDFDAAVSKLRAFCKSKGFLEVHTQDRLSILAACEDPSTISTFNYGGTIWPLPQTGQMWLEYELLKDPSVQGVFCVSTSFRNEPNPIEGRHLSIFSMFEFESKGNFESLISFEKELLTYLGFTDLVEKNYMDVADSFRVSELTHEHEEKLGKKYPVVLLKNFPEYTSPFWNMERKDDIASKVDVIMHGMETIGSAVRSTDKDLMRQRFLTISNGNYAQLLYEKFGKKRVSKELEDFFKLNFIPRYGGGIGIARLVRAMKINNLI